MPEHQDCMLTSNEIGIAWKTDTKYCVRCEKVFFSEVGDNQHASRHQASLLHTLLVKENQVLPETAAGLH